MKALLFAAGYLAICVLILGVAAGVIYDWWHDPTVAWRRSRREDRRKI